MIDRLLAPVPAQRWLVVRTAVVAYCLLWTVVRIPYWVDSARLPHSRWRPVGIGQWFGGPPPTAVVVALVVLAVGSGAATMAARWPVWGVVFAAAFLYLTSFGASWGQILHTENLSALHLVIVAAAPSGRGESATVGWPLRVMTAVTVATYFVAGVAKFRFGGGLDWLSGDRLVRLVAHDNLRKELLGDRASPLAPWLVGHRWLFRPAAWGTLVVEVAAPLALVSSAFRRVWVVLAWLFHVGVLLAMAVLFLYPLSFVAFASLLPAERLAALMGRPLARPSRLTESCS